MTPAWSDYPSSASQNPNLVNDLDSIVTTPSGQNYHGNQFTAPFNRSFDRTNNVEMVLINEPAPGRYALTVRAYNVSRGPQYFARAGWAHWAEPGRELHAPSRTPTPLEIGCMAAGGVAGLDEKVDGKSGVGPGGCPSRFFYPLSGDGATPDQTGRMNQTNSRRPVGFQLPPGRHAPSIIRLTMARPRPVPLKRRVLRHPPGRTDPRRGQLIFGNANALVTDNDFDPACAC